MCLVARLDITLPSTGIAFLDLQEPVCVVARGTLRLEDTQIREPSVLDPHDQIFESPVALRVCDRCTAQQCLKKPWVSITSFCISVIPNPRHESQRNATVR